MDVLLLILQKYTSTVAHVLWMESKHLQSFHRSIFELLLFFDRKDLNEEPLKHFTVTFQVKKEVQIT